MSSKTLKDRISLGRKLGNLSKSDDFAPFKAQMLEMLSDAKERALDIAVEPHEILLEIGKYRALNDLQEWMEDEIDTGASALLQEQKHDVSAIHEGPEGIK